MSSLSVHVVCMFSNTKLVSKWQTVVYRAGKTELIVDHNENFLFAIVTESYNKPIMPLCSRTIYSHTA